MSIWTFETMIRRALFALILSGLVAACLPQEPVTRARPAPERIAVSDNQVIIAGPTGYCIDPSAAKRVKETSFVLLGNCAAISRSGRKPQPQDRAFLTALVAPMAENGLTFEQSFVQLSDFFETSKGRASLSRSGRSQDLKIVEAYAKGDTFFLRARDQSAKPVANMSDEYWRAYFEVNGRIVTISAIGVSDQPISSAAGLRLLQVFADRIRNASKAVKT